MSKNVFLQDFTVNKKQRSTKYGHGALVIWFTGLSGAGKTTLAGGLEASLLSHGIHTYTLDGDNVRLGLNSDLGFSVKDRSENIRRVAEVAHLFLDANIVVLACFISPRKEDRARVRKIVGSEKYFEVYVKATIETCERRDVKGLYRKARNGEIKNMTGIHAKYEEPENPDICIDTDCETVSQSVKILETKILSKLNLKNE